MIAFILGLPGFSRMNSIFNERFFMGMDQHMESLELGDEYAYTITEDGGEYHVQFESPSMRAIDIWSKDRTDLIGRADMAIEAQKRYGPLFSGLVNKGYLSSAGALSKIFFFGGFFDELSREYVRVAYSGIQGETFFSTRIENLPQFLENQHYQTTEAGIREAQRQKDEHERAIEAEERRRQEQVRRANQLAAKLNEITDSLGLSGLAAGKVRAVLGVQLNYNGLGVLYRYQFIETMIQEGAAPYSDFFQKYAGASKAKWHKMSFREQRADEEKTKERVLGYRLKTKGEPHLVFSITKAEYDYAVYLVGKKNELEGLSNVNDDRIPCPECGELDYQAALLQDNSQIVCTNCGHSYRDE